MFMAHSRHDGDCRKQYKVSILMSLHSSGETTSKQIHIMIISWINIKQSQGDKKWLKEGDT